MFLQVNTFQCILATDGISSYSIFLYEDQGIQWTTSDRNGGIDGLGGNPALVGFDSGTGTVFNLPGSGTNEILLLGNRSNIDVPGVFVFRIGPIGITSGMSELFN